MASFPFLATLSRLQTVLYSVNTQIGRLTQRGVCLDTKEYTITTEGDEVFLEYHSEFGKWEVGVSVELISRVLYVTAAPIDEDIDPDEELILSLQWTQDGGWLKRAYIGGSDDAEESEITSVDDEFDLLVELIKRG